MTGCRDYNVLLRPDELLCFEISNLKGFAYSLIGEYKSRQSTAHISVMIYQRQKPYIMEQAIDNLNIRLRQMPAVKLQLNNFNFFIHKNDTFDIYAAIEPSAVSDKWFAELRKQFRISKSQLLPHISIARAISVDQFYRLWPRFRYMKCRITFHINCISILERDSLDKRLKWNIYREVFLKTKDEQMLHAI
ncbi:2'-5' RNA ligase family protein [Mucilaginibacter ginkgonis]|uniref:2'-5' RNA ligase family protein n=1 Tax=Mucilaginibacter ginkgonis TaxID=2682091 RepID=A0A6I4HW70_9SPHI|nr:2'-5' RNA ligase family protein [Mucilaginibacter ginkgonis]QQL50943.1 2'-5' RNA ligase family protein [Mucilaginibacter ginkgonis]